jgi:transposase
VAGVESLSREQLLTVLTAQEQTIAEQDARLAVQANLVEEQAGQIAALTVQVAELTRLLGRNSGNSSLPPSSDRANKPQRQPARRGVAGRKPGKQPGAPGAGLSLVADPDVVIDHEPGSCAGCGAGLAGAVDAGVIVRQVRDVPLPKITITEHRLHKRACACGRVSVAEAPAGVNSPVSYGPNLRAVAVYLVVYQHVPVERAAQLIVDLTGAEVSTGWVSGQVARAAEALVEVEELIKTLLMVAAVIGVDETSLNIAGTMHWLHVARTDTLTAYHRHEHRGRDAVKAFGILPNFVGTAVHDGLTVYDCYPAQHALCGAHLIRDLTDAAETHPGQHWPGQARKALADLAALAAQARTDGLAAIPAEQAAEPLKLYRHAVLVGLQHHRRADGRKQSKTRNLLQRLQAHETEILRFVYDTRIPFTNNGAERDLRPAKTQMKISGSHRSADGATNWLRVRGYISTVRKHGDDVLTALRDAITGNPWQPAIPAPT